MAGRASLIAMAAVLALGAVGRADPICEPPGAAERFCIPSTGQAIHVCPDGPAQAPVVYVHGFIDDGTGWARDSLYMVEELVLPVSIKYLRNYVLGPQRSPSSMLRSCGLTNYAVQWWTLDGQGDPFAAADQGFAFLQNAEQLLAGTDWVRGTWTAQNRPVPSALEVLTANDMDVAPSFLPVPALPLLQQLAIKAAVASQLLIRNTYNDAGRIPPRADDLLDMLRGERLPGGRLGASRQINVLTHSMGSLVTRHMLHLAENASRYDSEHVANVVYNAPPFGGSTMAYMAKLFFDPALVTRDVFADPRLGRMFETSQTTLRDPLRNTINVLLRPVGVDFADLYASLPDFARVPIDELDNHPISGFIDWAAISQDASGDALALAVNVLRPIVSGLLGFPGAPGYDDLTPEGGLAHLTGVVTNPRVRQFVTLGRQGFGIHLFPDDLAQVAADPALITDNAALSAQEDDTAVPVGSASLLTTTGAFGAQMSLLADLADLEHPDLLYRRACEMVPRWLEVLLAPPSTLVLSPQAPGDVQAVDAGQRSYLVRAAASFGFVSDPVERDLSFPILAPDPDDPDVPAFNLPDCPAAAVRVSAQHYEYRVLRADGSSELPSAWQTLLPGETRSFAQLRLDHALPGVPFRLEWRSLNERGARELIRSARIAIVAEEPQVLGVHVVTPDPAEVHRTGPELAVHPVAVRRALFSELAALDPLLAQQLDAIRIRPEAALVVRDPDTKALLLPLDQRGNIDWAWDDGSLASAQTTAGAVVWTVPLAGLSEGVHELYFETWAVHGGDTFRSPRQSLVVSVDHTPPVVSFGGRPETALGQIAVGPRTPLRFEIADLGTGGGTGSVSVAGSQVFTFATDGVFTLGETDLDELLIGANIASTEVSLQVDGRDLVSNATSLQVPLLFDVSPPSLSLVEVSGALPLGPGSWVTEGASVQIVVDASEQGAGLAGPPEPEVTSFVGGRSGALPPFALGAAPGHPTSWAGVLPLAQGFNQVAIRMRDLAGNEGQLVVLVEHRPEISDVDPVQLLTPRLDKDVCHEPGGTPVTCPVGDISFVSASIHGETYAFQSGGARLVPGDNNGVSDVFISRDGVVERMSETAAGVPTRAGCQRPEVSGNGRYVYFPCVAGAGLVPGATGINLYVKDRISGKLAVVSRNADGTPANVPGATSFQRTAATRSGRYVFMGSRGTQHVPGLVDTNLANDIFMVDLDPDADGDYFDDNYVTWPISLAAAGRTGNGMSRRPHVNEDGTRLVFMTAATDLHPDLADNGAVQDALLYLFTGSDATGDLDVSNPVIVPINREHSFSGTSVTPHGVEDVALAPENGDVVFSTRSNIAGTLDQNNVSLGKDVYLSLPTGGVGRFIAWVSHSFDTSSTAAMQSSENINAIFRGLSIGRHEPITQFAASKIAWVSQHTNLVPGDVNGEEDLFLSVNDGGASGFTPANWLAAGLPSAADVIEGGVTPDGRSAWWVTNQLYVSPYASSGDRHLYRRRLDVPVDTELTIDADPGGAVELEPPGIAVTPDVTGYVDSDVVRLVPRPDPGFRFTGWVGVDPGEEGFGTARVSMSESRTVRARFAPVPAPVSASAALETTRGQKSPGVLPVVVGDPSFGFVFSIVRPPANGRATVENNRLFYTPAAGHVGADDFEFQVTNGLGASLAQPALARVNTLAANRAPLAASLEIRTLTDLASCPATPTVVDPDAGDPHGFELLAAPGNGSVGIAGDQFVYTPDPGHLGSDDFSYLVRDAAGATLTAVGSALVEGALDADGDGVLENQQSCRGPADNCGAVANPDQLDSGGIGAASAADGIGDLCQCGALAPDGVVDPDDVAFLREALSGQRLLAADELARCSVYGVEPGTCNLVDLVVLYRALASPPQGPGVAQVCPAALG